MTSQTLDRLFAGLSALAGASILLLAPPPALAEPFRGPYVGANFGYQSAGTTSADGWSFGGFAGYNLGPAGRLVLGGEVALGGSTVSETVRRETATDVITIEDSVGLNVSVAGRLGLLAGERTLVYGRLGWDNVRLRQVQTRTPKPPVTNPRPETLEVSTFADSVTVGGGVEHYVTDRVSVRLDYDWAPSFERHQLRVGAAYSF